MENKTLHMMVGLPRCGKSTKAREWGFPIVNPDAIRMVIHGTPFRSTVEPLIWATAKILLRSLFLAGHNDVILDATNTTAERRAEWETGEWNVKYYVFNTPVDVCKKRAVMTAQDYLLDVIDKMNSEFTIPTDGDVLFIK